MHFFPSLLGWHLLKTPWKLLPNCRAALLRCPQLHAFHRAVWRLRVALEHLDSAGHHLSSCQPWDIPTEPEAMQGTARDSLLQVLASSSEIGGKCSTSALVAVAGSGA